MGHYIVKWKKMLSLAGGLSNRTESFCVGGQLKEPPAQMTLCAGGRLSHLPVKWSFLLTQSCWRVMRPPAKTGFSREDKSFRA
jgi:hypothetical protein